MAVGWDPGAPGGDVAAWQLWCRSCNVLITEGTGTPPKELNIHGPDLTDPNGLALRRHMAEAHVAEHKLDVRTRGRVTE